MKTPKHLEALIDNGLVDEVLYSLMSGKEASVYVVRCNNQLRCAKVYKESNKRSFRQATIYQEGRRVRSSRKARALNRSKRSKFAFKEAESAWQSTEVDALFRLTSAGVRVPKPFGFFEGVLLMEMIIDEHGSAAPRLNDITLNPREASTYYTFLIQQIILMLCNGLIHGDLSEFNILLSSKGPVIIDLPQIIDATSNNSAFKLLERDVNNITSYFAKTLPDIQKNDYAKSIWSLYKKGVLHPDIVLPDCFENVDNITDITEVLREIETTREDFEIRKKTNFF